MVAAVTRKVLRRLLQRPMAGRLEFQDGHAVAGRVMRAAGGGDLLHAGVLDADLFAEQLDLLLEPILFGRQPHAGVDAVGCPAAGAGRGELRQRDDVEHGGAKRIAPAARQRNRSGPGSLWSSCNAPPAAFSLPAGQTAMLSGSSQYGGGTFLQGGTLIMTNSAALGNGGLTISNGTLDLDTSPALNVTGLTGAGGVITKSTSGPCTLTVGPGSGAATSFAGAITNGNGVVALVLSDSADGGLTLSGNDSYTGGTTVLGGTLCFEGVGALASGTNLTVGTDDAVAFDNASSAGGASASGGVGVSPASGGVGVSPASGGVGVSPASVTAVPEPG